MNRLVRNIALARGTVLPTLILPLLGVAVATGCGDDPKPSPGTGATSGAAGKGGSAGKGGTGGKSGSGGASASGGKGGNAGEATGGSSGKGSGGSSGGKGGGKGGKGGTGGESGEGAGGDPGTGGTAGTAGGLNEGGMGGEPDPGPVYAPITKHSDYVLTTVHDLRGLVYAAGGKIYASGHIGLNDGSNATTGTDRQLAVVRFKADGTPDDTFGTNGVVTHNIVERVVDDTGPSPVVTNNGNEESFGILELESGELIVQATVRDAVGTGADVVLVKLDSAGARVTGFGTNGVKRIDFGWVDGVGTFPTANQTPSDTSWDIGLDDTVDGDEKIVVFGFGPARRVTTGTQRVDNDRYIVRVHASDGSIDTGFNAGAVFTLNSAGTFGDNARRGVVFPDGSILSAGYTNLGDGLGNHVVMIRLTPAGLPQTGFRLGEGIPAVIGFSPPGVARFNPFLPDGGVAECYAAGMLSDGSIVTTGYGRATAAGVPSSMGYATTDAVDLVSFKLEPSGELDTGYAVQGALAIQSEELFTGVDTEDRGRDLVVLPDDRIVQVGKFGPHPAIFVLKPDGTFDDSAGLGGRFEYDPLVRAADPTANPPVTALTTSHFYTVELSPNGRQIIAVSNNHELGVRVALLQVAATP
jgi:uncharacterized delta-60 repeat protein